jgi:hypothetical protein
MHAATAENTGPVKMKRHALQGAVIDCRQESFSYRPSAGPLCPPGFYCSCVEQAEMFRRAVYLPMLTVIFMLYAIVMAIEPP